MDSVHEQIAKRAFELFQARGGQHGYHIDDWVQAEQEIAGAVAKKAAAVAPKKSKAKAPDTAVKKSVPAEKKKSPAKKK